MSGSVQKRIGDVLLQHTPSGSEGAGLVNCWCGTERFDTFAHHADHVAAAVIEALGLTEEQRILTDGWIQPSRNIAFHIHGLTPPPAVITEESRMVSPWTETARRVE